MPQSDSSKPRTAGRDIVSIVMFFVIAAIALAVDLSLKHWSFETVAGQPVPLTRENADDPNLIPNHPGINLVPHGLMLKLTLNKGAVFGIGAGGRIFFIAVTFIAVVIVISLFWRSARNHRTLQIGLALVLAGALGNLYDRILYGAVRDMLYLFPGVHLPFGLSWPGGNTEVYPWIFNIADAALCVGVGLILFTMLRKPKDAQATQTS